MRKALLSAVMAISCVSNARAEYCNGQKITAVILTDDNVYFTTDKSCPNWCRISPGLAENQRDRMYSMLLTAASVNRRLSFYFAEAQGCEAVPTYSTPTAVIYTPD